MVGILLYPESPATLSHLISAALLACSSAKPPELHEEQGEAQAVRGGQAVRLQPVSNTKATVLAKNGWSVLFFVRFYSFVFVHSFAAAAAVGVPTWKAHVTTRRMRAHTAG